MTTLNIDPRPVAGPLRRFAAAVERLFETAAARRRRRRAAEALARLPMWQRVDIGLEGVDFRNLAASLRRLRRG
ncbi:MAG: hypothetical protein ACQEUZ_03425 [Pseudomonadota bacterium]